MFNGKNSQFGIWWPPFKAYCIVKEINEALAKNFMLPEDLKSVLTEESDAKAHKLKVAKNTASTTALILAFTTATLMDISSWCTKVLPKAGKTL